MIVVGLRCANLTYIRQLGLRLFATQRNCIFGRNAEPQLGETPMANAKLGLGVPKLRDFYNADITCGVTGFSTPSLMFRMLIKHPNVSVGVTNPDRH